MLLYFHLGQKNRMKVSIEVILFHRNHRNRKGMIEYRKISNSYEKLA